MKKPTITVQVVSEHVRSHTQLERQRAALARVLKLAQSMQEQAKDQVLTFEKVRA